LDRKWTKEKEGGRDEDWEDNQKDPQSIRGTPKICSLQKSGSTGWERQGGRGSFMREFQRKTVPGHGRPEKNVEDTQGGVETSWGQLAQ